MNDIFDLAASKKETNFIKLGYKIELDTAINIAETFSNFPFIGSLVRLGLLGNKYIEYHFIKKAAKFLQKDTEIPSEKKQEFLLNLTPKDRKRIHDYIMQYLLRAEDDEKAELMGFVYTNSSLKIEIKAKRLSAANQRVL